MADPVRILFEDQHLVVVDKPARMLVVQAPGRRGSTLVDQVGAQLKRRVYAVHRLEEDTTGVLVLAKTQEAKQRLEAVFRSHAAERRYTALVSHRPSPPAGRIESRLSVGSDGVVRSVDDGSGERAATEFRTIARRGRHTLVECVLDTGRRNQIRVHMADLGCPIVGDRKYGYRGPNPHRRPLLHASAIRLSHPFTGQQLDVDCEAAEPELRPG